MTPDELAEIRRHVAEADAGTILAWPTGTVLALLDHIATVEGERDEAARHKAPEAYEWDMLHENYRVLADEDRAAIDTLTAEVERLRAALAERTQERDDAEDAACSGCEAAEDTLDAWRELLRAGVAFWEGCAAILDRSAQPPDWVIEARTALTPPPSPRGGEE